MSSTKSLAGTEGIAVSTWFKRTLTPRLHSEHSCSAVQHISIDTCLDNLFVFSGSTPNTTVLQVKHKECGRFLQIVFMLEEMSNDSKMRETWQV